MFDYSKLRRRIQETVGSEVEYARRLGITPEAVSRKLNGKRGFKQREIFESIAVLKIDAKQIHTYFFKVRRVHEP